MEVPAVPVGPVHHRCYAEFRALQRRRFFRNMLIFNAHRFPTIPQLSRGFPMLVHQICTSQLEAAKSQEVV
jgi:hypothetical protein